MKKLLIFLTILTVSASAMARVKTTRKGLKVNQAKIETVETRDTVTGDTCRAVELAGFDKPLRSGYESMFVKNLSGIHLLGIIVECNYLDSNRRQLHKRTVTIPCSIPAGQTRQVRFHSWDTQQSFYYRLSARPRRSEAVSFDVECTVKAIITKTSTRK